MAFNITVGIGLAILLSALAEAASEMTGVTSDAFMIAKVCWFITAADIIGFTVWLLLWRGKWSAWKGTCVIFISFLTVYALGAVIRWTDFKEAMASKILIPADPTPRKFVENLPLNENPVAVLLGSSIAWAMVMPHTIVSMGRKPMLEIDRDQGTTRIVIKTVRIFDDRNDIIARISSDEFWVADSSRWTRPDPSTLVVYDHNDDEVLRVHFLDPLKISVTGIFRYPGIPPVVVTPERVNFGNGNYIEGEIMGSSAGGPDIDIGRTSVDIR